MSSVYHPLSLLIGKKTLRPWIADIVRSEKMIEHSFIKTCLPAARFCKVTGIVTSLLLSGSNVGYAAGMYHEPAGPSPVTNLIKSPQVPFSYALGMTTFREKCSACHGQWAEGVAKTGPPLVHRFYEPSHHSDDSFYRAALHGVKQHHWSFGDMAPVADVSRKQVANIIRFLRWWQRENGIK